MIDEALFEEIGLSKGETKVYLTLLEIGTSKVGRVIEKSKLQSSTVHTCLNTLLEKGLIKFVKKGKIKHYTATDPKFLLEILKDRERRVENILPELELKRQLAEDKEESEVYKGLSGIKSMLQAFISDGEKGDEFLFFGGEEKEYDEAVGKVYLQYDKRRQDMGLKVYGVVPSYKRGLYGEFDYIEPRYADFPLPPNMGIFRNKILIISWNDAPTGFLIESKVIAEQYRQMFWNIWKVSKK